ncbi:MAG: hypothetical protein AAGK66_10290, partial [Pseudomonadota bacterium]
DTNNTPPRVRLNQTLSPDREAGSSIAPVSDAPGLYNVTLERGPSLNAGESARGLVHAPAGRGTCLSPLRRSRSRRGSKETRNYCKINKPCAEMNYENLIRLRPRLR